MEKSREKRARAWSHAAGGHRTEPEAKEEAGASAEWRNARRVAVRSSATRSLQKY
jgi:hypothetical protein